MFKTIFTVRKRTGSDYGSNVFSAHFENFDEAKRYAESEVKKVEQEFTFSRSFRFDGSFCYSWISDYCWISLDDNAWVTDFRFNGFGFHDETGLLIGDFETMEDLRAYWKRSQELAINVS